MLGGAAEARGGWGGGGVFLEEEEDHGGACRTLSRCSSDGVVANEAPVHSCGGWVEGDWAQRGGGGQWEGRGWARLSCFF